MTTFNTQFGQGPPRDLYYPSVLTPDMKLDGGKVSDAFRRVFDELYRINPPVGARTPSVILESPGFIDQFTINLDTDVFMLSGEIWNSSTAGVSWNEHTLTYGGTAYTIAPGGPTTNKFIYWTLQDANKYSSSATFPTLDFINPASGGVASGLVGVWNASDGKFYPFWGTKLAPAFISTALIEDAAITNAKIVSLQASKITAGTLDVGVIYAGSISVSQLTAGTLSVTATITGGKIRTAASGARIELDDTNGLILYNSGGINVFQAYLTGSVRTDSILGTVAGTNLVLAGDNVATGGVSIGARSDMAAGGAALFSSSSIAMLVNNVSELAVTNTYGLQIITHGLKFDTSGQGIQWIDTNSSALVATASAIDFYTKVGASRTNTARFDNTSHATNSNFYLYHNGSLKQVIVNTILGVNYLTV